MPDCSTGSVIMNMISSTSTTSTKGVMLISASEVRVFPLLLVKATLDLPLPRILGAGAALHLRCLRGNLFKRVQQLAGKIIGRRGEHPHARGELVVCHYGRNGDEQAGGRGDQRFGNARPNGAQLSGSGFTQALECLHD